VTLSTFESFDSPPAHSGCCNPLQVIDIVEQYIGVRQLVVFS
jgi:hypothetical protein